MQRRSTVLRFAVSVLAAVLITAMMGDQARATVTWSFFETGISCFNPSACSLPPQSFVFATLT